MEVTPLVWGVSVAVLAVILFIDIVVLARRPHIPSFKENLSFILGIVALALLFAAGLWYFEGWAYTGQFLAGWITEYSLSVDNLFVFMLIMAGFKVPQKYQNFALLVGIVLALVFRGVFIALGAAIIEAWAWAFFVFGAFLLITAIKLVKDFGDDDDETQDLSSSFFMRLVRRILPTTDEFDGEHLVTKVNGRPYFTPMMLVIVALGSTDIMFALDSIPAIYGLTQQPYLVFMATVFALLGLRQLYFLLGSALKKLIYLSIGLAVILAFIGIKLVLHAAHHYGWVGFEISTGVSLGVIILTLVITTLASLSASKQAEKRGLSEIPPEGDPTQLDDADLAEAER